jgi:hypothetical protein
LPRAVCCGAAAAAHRNAYAFAGFFSPVDNDAVNRITAGRSVPMKFSLGGDFGLVIAPSSPASYLVNCDGGVPESDVEDTDTAGQSVLQYNPDTGTYTYVWKTSTAWAKGTCVTFEMTLTDGSTHTAEFKVK